MLRAHRLRQLRERHQLGLGAAQPDNLVFSTPEGEPLHPGLFSDTFDRRVRAAGVPRIRFHDVRHAFTTLSLAAGVSPKVVQERLGQSGIAIKLDVSSQTIPASWGNGEVRGPHVQGPK